MIDGIFILKGNGICLASTINGTVSKTDPHLISPFLDALDSFTDVNFDGTLKAFFMEDNDGNERRVYFKKLRIFEDVLKIIAIFSKKKGFPWGNFKEVDAKMIEFKWLMQEKNWHVYLNASIIPFRVLEEIEEGIKKIFNIFF
ncbi:MAG: hypothetical protein ACTSUE_01225 [Promethearchaeota archaeon]